MKKTQQPHGTVFEFLDGKPYTLDGIHGYFKHEVHTAIYPYQHTYERLIHEADGAGRNSVAYGKVRQQLGDDYVTDLTDATDTYCGIAYDLGYHS